MVNDAPSEPCPGTVAPLRVAIVAPSTRILGGQAVQAARLVRAWEGDRDVAARLLPINPLPPRWLRWALRLRYARTLATQLVYWPLLVRELRRADVAHVFSASYLSFLLAPLPAVLIAKMLKVPVVLNYRSGEAPDHLQRSAVARRTLARVDRNVVPSRFLQGVFASFGVPAHVVPNLVDVERFRFRLRDPIAPKLVSTRNFEPLYNVACTLRAFRRVQDAYPDASLTLVGAGTLERPLRGLARELALRNVTFAGPVAPDDVWRCYADADIYIQTPDIDNMPSSVLEAFSSGTPVVSTGAGGVPAILTGDVDGLLAPLDDDRAVAAQVLRLLREPGLATRLAVRARQRCEAYTWARVRTQWFAVYRAVAQPPATVPASAAPGTDAISTAGRHTGRGTRLARLREMDGREVTFRARALLVRGGRRSAAIARAPRWRRRDLGSRLVTTDAAMQTVHDRLAEHDWMGAHRQLMRHFLERPPRFLPNPASRRALVPAIAARFPDAADEAAGRADRILAGRYDLLGYRDLQFGGRADRQQPGLDVDWALDPVHDRRPADGWWSAIRYLDSANGDHKIVWELNRHQHWLALGRAWWLTGRDSYRLRFVAELESWLAQNPPLHGINWASMLELSLRSVSWLWALHFFVDASREHDGVPWLVDLLLALDRQMQHVAENLSEYFSPNTHFTGEALGLYVVGRVLPELRRAARWETTGRRILVEQAAKQVSIDGGHAERSTHYHHYTLDFYLLALAVARATGDETAERAFAPVVERLARFAGAMADTTGVLPRIGDDDAGSLMPLCGNEPGDVRASLSMAATLLPDRVPAGDLTEESLWIAGGDRADTAHTAAGRRPRSRIRVAGCQPSPQAWNRSTAFPITGYYVSRTGTGDHLVFDAGPHGFLNGGHAHADALSLTLAIRWHRFLIDPGTGSYTMSDGIRDRFRSTAMHNTLVLDGRPQSRPGGPFHWTTSANGCAVRSAFNPQFDFFEGAHDGYGPDTHRRAVFSAAGDLWLVADHVLARGLHTAAVQWHLDPEWDVRVDDGVIEATHAGGLCAALATTAGRLEVFRGDEASGLGWCSPAYGRIVPCSAVRVSRAGDAPFSIATLVVPARRACGMSIDAVPVTGTADGGYAFAVRATNADAIDVAMFVVRRDDPFADAATHNPGHSAGRVVRQFAGFETDARFACVRLSSSGQVRSVSLVDGSLLQRLAGDPFRLQLPREVGDLTVTIDESGLVEIFSSVPLPAIALDAPASPIARAHVNDSPASFRRTAAGILVPPARSAGVGRRSVAAKEPVGPTV